MRQGIRRFFRYARLRHEAYLAKQAGVPIGKQSRDPILNQYRFTNVFRELDKTTAWFRKYVREPLRDKPEVLLATVLLRLLNRIEVGEAIFCQTFMTDEGGLNTAFEKYAKDGNTAHLRIAVHQFVGKKGPHCTGAYIISSPPGYSKLDGVLKIVDDFNRKSDWRHWTDCDPAGNECTLEAAWEFLKDNKYFGPFHSYEMVTDLRHTALLERAPDVMTWASVGPGCRRGLNRVMGRDKRDHAVKTADMLDEMRELLAHSRNTEFWPNLGHSKNAAQWPRWEMREVEHTLCEFDKYERVRLGEGRPRGVYR